MNKWNVFYKQFITYNGYKMVLDGLLKTVEIAVFGLFIGIIIGTIISLIKVMPGNNVFIKIGKYICNFYVGLFRGTPMVVQLLIGYYVLLPAMNIVADSVIVAIVMFGLNSGAYVSEIMRSGIQSVDSGQLEAGRALGLTFWTTMIRIVIPQSFKNILPTLGNEFITLVKETSVVSFIAVVDLTEAFKQIGSANYEFVIPYLFLALIYLVLVYMISLLVKFVERRMAKSDRQS